MKFVEQYLSPCINEQLSEMNLGHRTRKIPVSDVVEEALKCAYADGYNSGEKKAMWRTIWHPMSTDPLRVVNIKDRRGYYIDVNLYDGETVYNGTFDIMAGKFSHEAVAWKLIDRPDMEKLYEMEELWPEKSTEN